MFPGSCSQKPTDEELQAGPDTYNYNPKLTSSRLAWATQGVGPT